jgi:SAM-dependent methyltransferase
LSASFGNQYADVYDILYRDKDYAGEVALLDRIFAEQGRSGPLDILDLGCGTGSHAFPLAARGHRVIGIDNSSGMLAKAEAKARASRGATTPRFRHGDVRALDLGRRFDAVIMMFAVLGYQHANADLNATLDGVRRHLEPGGLFVFDVWNGSAVLSDPPGSPVREMEEGDMRITRTTTTRVDAVRHRCHVLFHVAKRLGERVVEEHEEEHVMRYFFPQELDLALGFNGLRLLDLRRFPGYDAPADERAWNMIGVAKAI